MPLTPKLTVIKSEEFGPLDDAARLRAARLAVMRGYEQAVDILSPGPSYGEHPELPWFERGLADYRRIAGLRRVRASRRAPSLRPA